MINSMNKTMALSSALVATLLLSACATSPKNTLAIQNANNQYEVSGLGKDQVVAKNNAIAAANSTCGRKATPVLINEKTSYNGALKGVFDEETGRLVTAAAGVIGSIVGRSAGLAKDTDYQSVLTFTCRAN